MCFLIETKILSFDPLPTQASKHCVVQSSYMILGISSELQTSNMHCDHEEKYSPGYYIAKLEMFYKLVAIGTVSTYVGLLTHKSL